MNLTKHFGARAALLDVSFEIFPGEFVGLLGPNGAGKTTLASIVAGLIAPDSGVVELFGTGIKTDRSAVLAKLGMVFQSRSLDLEMSVSANLRFHAALFGIAGRSARDRIDELAELLEFGPLLTRPVRTLSGGNQRRVEIARALLNRPQLVLMDEATAGLDPAARPALLEHVHELCRREGTAVMWVTHLLDEVAEADRLFILSQAVLQETGTPDEIICRSGGGSLLSAYTILAKAVPGQR
jgi:ABC-2 type transport system ATP-binding protein